MSVFVLRLRYGPPVDESSVTRFMAKVHAFTPKNTRRPNGRDGRACRVCLACEAKRKASPAYREQRRRSRRR